MEKAMNKGFTPPPPRRCWLLKGFGAFTLAEVLITLGIIGVVAAITIPTLIKNHQEKVTITKLKKIYSSLDQGLRLTYQSEGEVNTWGLDEIEGQGMKSAEMINKLAKNVRFIKNCGTATGCWADTTYNDLHGSYSNLNTTAYLGKAVMGDSTNVLIYYIDSNCQDKRGENLHLANICATLEVDINGYKPPNTYGKDLFKFYITKYGLYPTGSALEYLEKNSFERLCISETATGATGSACAAWVIYNENMDYLHCDDLSWDGKRKCD